jgi:hypothetical protein
MTVWRMMCLVAIVAFSLAVADAVRMSMRSAGYRREAESAARMDRRCREIDAMDSATRDREAEAAYDDPYLDNPAWNRRRIPYFEELKRKDQYAAEHPRGPIPPDPPNP